MHRREFLTASGLAGVAAAAGGLTASSGKLAAAGGVRPNLADLPDIDWEMPTSWPLALDTLFGGAEMFAEWVARLTDDKFRITARAGGELVPGLEILPTVESGAYPIGHTASYYYTGLAWFTAFGTDLPFGLSTRGHNAWMYEGGGAELMNELYADRFDVITFPAGNTGAQWGGWFNREIQSVDDLAGLTVRIPGLGGRVMERLGATVQQIAGGEIFQALQTGAIDAAEWVGPYDDTVLGLHEAAEHYYFPAFWEPGPSLDVMISLSEWEGLPAHYQNAIEAAAYIAAIGMTARYDQRNADALTELLENDDVQIHEFPEDFMEAAHTEARALYVELQDEDEDFARVFESWDAFRAGQARLFGYSEGSLLQYHARFQAEADE